jgi:CDP-diacylglycerol--serine O-phosphatidyltransferase
MKKRRKKSSSRKRRGIYLLPNLITTASLFLGFYSIVSSVQGRFHLAAFAVLGSIFFDGLDGHIARLTHSTSRFGVEYDSLADLVAFGLAPALMVYLWALESMGRLGWLAAFLFVACGALRLARFNVQTGQVSNKFFRGLPIPAAAGVLATTVLFFRQVGLYPSEHQTLLMVEIYVLSFLMVSTIQFFSIKDLDFFRRKSFNTLVAALLLFVVVAAKPQVMLFLLGICYVACGPIYYVLRKRKPAAEGACEKESEPTPSETGS